MFFNNDMNSNNYMDDNMNVENTNCTLEGIKCPSMCECPRERCQTREIHHCIEHIVPINTKIINHHIYHHIYKPVYTCTEENVCSSDSTCCM